MSTTMKTSKTTSAAEMASGHKLYKRRWFMLILFIIYAFNGSQQWAQFTIINNLVTKYYNVTTTQVEWTANVFTLSYIILVIPALYLIKLMGVRNTMIVGALGITVGNWIKVLSVAPDRFQVAFIGQCVSVSFLMLTFGLLGRFTATWFGADEISTAGVLAILGDQLGAAFAYFFPTVLVKDGPLEVIGNGLWNMHLCVSILSTVIFFLILVFFQEKPKMPPSVAQIKQKQVKEEKLLPTLGKLMKKPPFLLFLVSYGLNGSSCVGLATCLNELIVVNFPGGVSDAGNIGSTIMLSGIVSSLLIGKILDKTRLFKECANVLTTGTALSMMFFTWSLKSGNIFYVYLAAGLLGFFVMGYYSVGMQIGIELTYPIHEEISTAISFLSTGVFAFVFTIVYGYTIKSYGDLASNIGISVLVVISCIITFCLPVDLKRQRAENEPKEKPSELDEFI
ncbi:uncharacterized MFS-type transporter C09D4.1-like [Planococcus citri]|uniref:uncharacterized MFS-type transporter C09D4.1-like n=1 Tax=Planococcus citri TaxID=170843 RepID=UPI0031FA213D